MNKSRGFTLLEILLVVGIIAILAGIVIVALNPTKQFSQVRNTQRKANLNEIHKALYQYYIDNSRYPTTVPIINLGEICNTGASSTPTGINCTGLVDLSPLVPTYLTAIPTDPQATGTSTLYSVAKNAANKIYVKALNAELSQTVTLGPSEGILPDHLVSYWSFDGNANDSWGTNNGTVVGATATTGVKGVANTAYAFNGTSDYISTTANVSGYSFTFAVWIKTSQTGSCSDGIIIGGPTAQPSLYFLNNKVLLYEAGSNYRYSSSTFCDNQWHFITAVYRYGAVESNIYIDGVANESGGTSSSQIPSNVPSAFYIAKGGGNYFKGAIDNVHIYSKALTIDEMKAIYNAEKP